MQAGKPGRLCLDRSHGASMRPLCIGDFGSGGRRRGRRPEHGRAAQRVHGGRVPLLHVGDSQPRAHRGVSERQPPETDRRVPSSTRRRSAAGGAEGQEAGDAAQRPRAGVRPPFIRRRCSKAPAAAPLPSRDHRPINPKGGQSAQAPLLVLLKHFAWIAKWCCVGRKIRS